ncbi:polysaccharide deacetylase family protein [Candidatus Kaiserbacteria bacterium]|nr:polysaccharide deacetylase family protein [Candidatus Kaiserbacteria bacterium]
MRRFLKRLFVLKLYYSGFNWLCGRLMTRRIYLVGYHNIDTDMSKYAKVTISPDVFEQHLEYLKYNGHTFVSLERLLSDDLGAIRKPTVIYFDDGFKSVLTNALSILKKFGAAPTVFVTTDYIGRESYLSWDDVHTLAAQGATIGAHGETHTHMTQCTPEQLQTELVEPRARIKSECGIDARALAYPNGRVNDTVEGVAQKAGYVLGISSVEGTNSISDLKNRGLRLKKIAPKPYDDLMMFKVKVYSWNLALSLTRLWS